MDHKSLKDITGEILAPIVAVTRVRWYVCTMYAYMAFMQGLMWFTFSSIPEVSEEYYDMSAHEVDVLLSWGSVVIILLLPFSAWIASRKRAIKHAIIIGSVSQLAGGLIRFIPCLLSDEHRRAFGGGHLLLHVGQIVIAISGPIVFSTPSRVAFEWFPDSERNIATSIIMNATTLAQAIGYIIGPLLAPDPESVPILLGVELLMTVPLTVCSLVRFPALPKHPPSTTTAAQREELEKIVLRFSTHSERKHSPLLASLKSFWGQVRTCTKNPHFVAIVLVFGLYIAVLIVWDGLLPQILTVRFTASLSGWMGFGAMIAGILFCQVYGVLSDKVFKRKIPAFFCVSMVLTMVLLVLIALSFPGVFWTKKPLINASSGIVALLVVAVGGFFTAPYGLVYVLAAEMSYPVNESISAVLVSWIESVVAMVFLYVWPLCPTQYFVVLTFVGCLICLVAMLFIKTDYPDPDAVVQENGKEEKEAGYAVIDEETEALVDYVEPDFLVKSLEYSKIN